MLCLKLEASGFRVLGFGARVKVEEGYVEGYGILQL